MIWGVGKAAVRALEGEGIRTIADLRARDRKALIRRFGSLGDRLWRLAHGEDARRVTPDHPLKSVSHETTFAEDTADLDLLRWHLWSLAEQVSARAKAKGIAGSVVTLKLKRADHGLLTRRQTLATPTQMADRLYRTALPMLRRDMSAGSFPPDRGRPGRPHRGGVPEVGRRPPRSGGGAPAAGRGGSRPDPGAFWPRLDHAGTFTAVSTAQSRARQGAFLGTHRKKVARERKNAPLPVDLAAPRHKFDLVMRCIIHALRAFPP